MGPWVLINANWYQTAAAELSKRSGDDVISKIKALPFKENVHLSRLIDGIRKAAMSLSLLEFVGQASLVDDAMLPS